MKTTNERLAALRSQMNLHGLDAYIVPSSDPHQSEYVAERWQARTWISGFTGSMGYVVVTPEHAGVWTDSRYFLQCETEIKNTEFALHKQGVQGAPEHLDWLLENVPLGKKIGCDGSLFSVEQIRGMKRIFAKKNIELVTNLDLFDAIWNDRPSLPTNEIFEHETRFSGQNRTQRIEAIRVKMREKNANFNLISTLDDIGWTLNLRGSDVECNPVFVAYLVVGLEKTHLFIDPKKVPDDLKLVLKNDNILIEKYENIGHFLAQLVDNQTIIIDADNANFQLFNSIVQAKIIESATFSIAMKAIKNEVEIGHIRNVMVKDGVALVKAFRWLEHALDERPVSEYELASMLAQFRSDQVGYFGESFAAIVGYKSNGAIIHYRPMPETCAMIKKDGILLVDSGGQYQDGTTDITRTITLGEPTDEEKTNFTLVLRGHVALAEVQFPAGTKGVQLDILARIPLWQNGLNYGHGTGHGVGFFMNVHEPPQGIVPALNARGKTIHEVGMLTSNEPGFYKEGAYGIRIENLILAKESVKTDFGQFLNFETVTLFPIDTRLVTPSVLGQEGKIWLNKYHERVFEKLSPLLDAAETAWLKEKCRAI